MLLNTLPLFACCCFDCIQSKLRLLNKQIAIKTTDIRTTTPAMLDPTIVALFSSLEDAARDVVMMRLVVLLKDVFNDVTENVKDFLEGEVLAVHVNNPLLLVLAFDFEDGEFVLAMNLLVALPLVGQLLLDNAVSLVNGGWDVYVVLLTYFVLEMYF